LPGKYSSRKFVAFRRVSLAKIGRSGARSPPLSSSRDRPQFAVGEDRARSAARLGSEAPPVAECLKKVTLTQSLAQLGRVAILRSSVSTVARRCA
jgi:hypothetical protein